MPSLGNVWNTQEQMSEQHRQPAVGKALASMQSGIPVIEAFILDSIQLWQSIL